MTVSMALNALAFKGKWSSVFDPGKTTSNYAFHLWGGKIGVVDMMLQTESFEYAEDDQYQLLRMPYGNGAFEMVFLLPLEKNGDVQAVSLEQWERLLSKAEEKELPVGIPKFKIETALSLDGHLSNMGMPTSFSGEADFSLIADVPGTIRLKDTRQACYIEVDESGAKAAAATVIPAGLTGAPLTKKTEFIADHPFLFAIIERSTQGILLMGQFCGQ